MKIGFIGLGKMGLNMVRRLLLKNHEIVVKAKTKKSVLKAKKYGAIPSFSTKDFLEKLPSKKIIWLMLPFQITEKMIKELIPFLKPGDLIIDGGNSYYKDSILRYNELKKKKISFLDIGTSGGIWGLTKGYCLMVGGDKKEFSSIKPILKDLSSKNSYLYVGKPGSGHFVKMVHNGIEYGAMQAYAEGFELLKNKDFNLNLHQISKLWNKNSVIRSWLLELLENIFKKDQNLKNIKDYVKDSGEGRWTIKEAIDLDVPLHIISSSLYQRFSSRQKESYSSKVLAALRKEFGGHNTLKKS